MPRRKLPKSDRRQHSVFLNIPYDSTFENLYLAYLAGLTAFGLHPRATLEIPGSQRRLDRILRLIQDCAYSIHDLSRVQLDRTTPRTPRFNMPFELGLAVALDNGARAHAWYVCETVPYRVHKSLSDLDGTEVYIHEGTIRGVFGQLCNAFVQKRQQPTVQQMYRVYRVLKQNLPMIRRRFGATHPYTASVFRELNVLATSAFQVLRRDAV
jgi:hypothetical protein